MSVFLFIALLLFLGVAFTVGLVMPKKIMVITSETIINKPKDAVWNYVKLLRNQANFNTWLLQDPNIKIEYSGTDGEPGFILAWQSKTRIGNGQQEILMVKEGESCETELRFSNLDNTTRIRKSVEAIENNKTKVVTVMSATPSFPISLMIPVIKKAQKKGMDENNAKLKSILEA